MMPRDPPLQTIRGVFAGRGAVATRTVASVEVGVSELRAHFREWLALVRAGEEVVVTNRGVPVARLVGVDAATTLDRLTADGVIARPKQPHRPKAAGQRRPHPRSPVADRVSEQRR